MLCRKSKAMLPVAFLPVAFVYFVFFSFFVAYSGNANANEV